MDDKSVILIGPTSEENKRIREIIRTSFACRGLILTDSDLEVRMNSLISQFTIPSLPEVDVLMKEIESFNQPKKQRQIKNNWLENHVNKGYKPKR